MNDSNSYLTIVGGPDGSHVVALMEYDSREDDYRMVKTSHPFKLRVDAYIYGSEWAKNDNLEIR